MQIPRMGIRLSLIIDIIIYIFSGPKSLSLSLAYVIYVYFLLLLTVIELLAPFIALDWRECLYPIAPP